MNTVHLYARLINGPDGHEFTNGLRPSAGGLHGARSEEKPCDEKYQAMTHRPSPWSRGGENFSLNCLPDDKKGPLASQVVCE